MAFWKSGHVLVDPRKGKVCLILQEPPLLLFFMTNGGFCVEGTAHVEVHSMY